MDEPPILPSPESEPFHHPKLRFQFRLTTILATTAYVAVLLGLAMQLQRDQAIFLLVFCFVPSLAVPSLVERCQLSTDRAVRFSILTGFLYVLVLGLYPLLMISLATIAFVPDYKGDKGEHWTYYLLDAPAGLTLFPFYIIALGSIVAVVIRKDYATRSRMIFVMLVTATLVDVWYTLATLFLNFTKEEESIALVPATVGLGHGMLVLLIWKHREFSGPWWPTFIERLVIWLSGITVALLAKIPMARDFYDELPDHPPPGCFIVSTAALGHRRFVGSWFDPLTGRAVNRQLLLFREFEALLQRSLPSVHIAFRRIYNVMGPRVARRIRYHWQADVIFATLKPAEAIVRLIMVCFGNVTPQRSGNRDSQDGLELVYSQGLQADFNAEAIVVISKDMLEKKILVCPENHMGLQMADAELVAKLNQAVAAGTLKNMNGEAVEQPLDGGLLREDGKFLYPVIDKIPVLLVDEAIAMEQFDE